jgi:hypothetical protein
MTLKQYLFTQSISGEKNSRHFKKKNKNKHSFFPSFWMERNLNTLYLEREKIQLEVKLLLAQDRTLLNQREALLDEKEEILRHSRHVCSICLEPAAEGTMRALDPCGHCFCATCVVVWGVVLTDEIHVGTHTYVGA